MPGTTLLTSGDEPQLDRELAERARAAAIDAARGLADVDVADLPIEAQAAWARMARPVLRDLLDAVAAGGAR